MYGRGDHLSGTDGECRLEIVGGRIRELILSRKLSGILFLWISKITNEAIGYGDSLAILILGIYLGIWGLLEVLMTAFFILGIIGLICVVIKRKKKGLAFPFYPFLTVGYLLGVCIGGI